MLVRTSGPDKWRVARKVNLVWRAPRVKKPAIGSKLQINKPNSFGILARELVTYAARVAGRKGPELLLVFDERPSDGHSLTIDSRSGLVRSANVGIDENGGGRRDSRQDNPVAERKAALRRL